VFLDRDAPTPLYAQVAQWVYDDIASGRLRPGAPIGSEAELGKRFQVSRITLRHAVSLLVQEGIVTRKHGKGTYVETAPLDYPLGQLLGTTQAIARTGQQSRSKVVRFRQVRGMRDERRILGVDASSKILQIRRVDYVSSIPIAVADISLPGWLANRISRAEVETTPLYPLLREKVEISVEVAHQTLRADKAPKDVAQMLDAEPGAAVMVVTRVALDQQQCPIEYSTVHFNADAVRFSVSLRRQQGQEREVPFGFQKHVRMEPRSSTTEY
jgi:GntR family transcriptional regulator